MNNVRTLNTHTYQGKERRPGDEYEIKDGATRLVYEHIKWVEILKAGDAAIAPLPAPTEKKPEPEKIIDKQEDGQHSDPADEKPLEELEVSELRELYTFVIGKAPGGRTKPETMIAAIKEARQNG